MIYVILGIATIYLLGTIFIAGKSFAYWQRGWDRWITDEDKKGDFVFSIITGLIWWGSWMWVLTGSQPTSGRKYRSFGWTLNYRNPHKNERNKTKSKCKKP